jgi:hypothetical protein
MRRSRPSFRVVTLASALALTLSYGALFSAPASAGTKWKLVDSGKASGQNALANANGEVLNPKKIEVTVTAASFVQWTVECTKGGKLITLPSGKTTLKGAGSVQLKITKSAANCQLAASAENYGTGTIKLSIEQSGGTSVR